MHLYVIRTLTFFIFDRVRSRLLHQGASAVDILQYYIDCIKSVSIIDPSCDIMESIIELIESYLK